MEKYISQKNRLSKPVPKVCEIFSANFAENVFPFFMLFCLGMYSFQTPMRRLLKMSMKTKLTTCINKVVDTAMTCENFYKLENPTKSLPSPVQAFFLLDTGKKAHVAGFGTMFNNFLQNQDLGNYTGKGTTPVESTDPNSRNSSLVIERYQEPKGKHKRENQSKNKSCISLFRVNAHNKAIK